MARTRTTKKLAQRIDLNYFKRPTPFKRAKLWLCILLPLFAIFWIAERAIFRDHRVFSSGRLSEPHAILEKECATCHVREVGAFSAKVEEAACLACHDGPAHHATRSKTPACAQCHSEHRGRVNISAASNQSCAECHGDLRAAGGMSNYANSIRSFQHGHPQFLAVRNGARDPGTIKLNHAIHMKPVRRGPNGPVVQLDCGDCHRPVAVKAAWNYSDANYAAAKSSYSSNAELVAPGGETLMPRRTPAGRENMAPVKFATACASCHLLTFDKRSDEGVPHDKPEAVHAFLVNKFTAYIAAHPNELRETRDPDRDLTGKQATPRSQALTVPQWVAERTAVAEELLWHKTCAQCHTMTNAPLQDIAVGRWSSDATQNAAHFSATAQAASLVKGYALPLVASSKTVARWMPHARFDHDAHRGFSCEGCHPKALTSTETSEVLVPGIATCQTCHAPGPNHAESRCFECHTYHDWSKRKEVKPVFTLPGLKASGR